MLALAGCVELDADLELNRDAEATGQMSVAVDKQAASFAGILDLESFETALQEDGTEGIPSDAQLSYEETASAYVVVADLDNVDLDDADLSAEADDGTVTFRYASEAVDADALGGPDLGRIRLVVTFPGDLTSVTGAEQVDDRTIEYAGSLGDAADVTAVAEVRDLTWLLVAFAAAVVLVLVVLAVGVVILRQGRRPEPVSSP